MKIIYLSTARVPDDWAHVIHIMHMCESFAHTGVQVELVTPRRAATSREDPFEHAGVEKNFTITKLPCIDLFAGTTRKLPFFIRTFSFLLAARVYLFFRSYDVLYTRERLASIFFRGFVYESHSVSHTARWVYRRLFARAANLVVLTGFIRDSYVAQGFPKDRIHVEPDAVDVERFSKVLSKGEARQRFGLPINAPVIGYAGTLKTLGMEKGVATAIESLSFVPRAVLCVVGGEPQDVEEYRSLAHARGVGERVIFTGKVAHDLVPLYLAAFDVVVAPFPDYEHYRLYMSPLKIFEYMASGVPMIVSDLPSLREVLSEKTTRFVSPGDAKALASAVEELLSNTAMARQMAECAREEVEKYTWDARAKRILAFLERTPSKTSVS